MGSPIRRRKRQYRQHTCESCGRQAEVRTVDGSYWCIACDTAARRQGYDNLRGRIIGGEFR